MYEKDLQYLQYSTYSNYSFAMTEFYRSSLIKDRIRIVYAIMM